MADVRNKGGRPSAEMVRKQNYLKEQFQHMEREINQLEEICKAPNIAQKDEFVGTIGLLVGKLGVRYINIVSELEIFKDD